jgi:hypothetical protein
MLLLGIRDVRYRLNNAGREDARICMETGHYSPARTCAYRLCSVNRRTDNCCTVLEATELHSYSCEN